MGVFDSSWSIVYVTNKLTVFFINIPTITPHITSRTCCRRTYFLTELTQDTCRLLLRLVGINKKKIKKKMNKFKKRTSSQNPSTGSEIRTCLTDGLSGTKEKSVITLPMLLGLKGSSFTWLLVSYCSSLPSPRLCSRLCLKITNIFLDLVWKTRPFLLVQEKSPHHRMVIYNPKIKLESKRYLRFFPSFLP